MDYVLHLKQQVIDIVFVGLIVLTALITYRAYLNQLDLNNRERRERMREAKFLATIGFVAGAGLLIWAFS